MRKQKKLKKLGEGFIWFLSNPRGAGYSGVALTDVRNGETKPLKIGKLWNWNKVRLYVEVLK